MWSICFDVLVVGWPSTASPLSWINCQIFFYAFIESLVKQGKDCSVWVCSLQSVSATKTDVGDTEPRVWAGGITRTLHVTFVWMCPAVTPLKWPQQPNTIIPALSHCKLGQWQPVPASHKTEVSKWISRRRRIECSIPDLMEGDDPGAALSWSTELSSELTCCDWNETYRQSDFLLRLIKTFSVIQCEEYTRNVN